MALRLPGLALLALAVLAASATAQTIDPVVVSWEVPFTGSHNITAQCGQGVRFDWASGEFHDLAEQYSGEPTLPITSLCSTSTMGQEWQETAGGPLSYTIAYNASLPNIRNFFCAVGTHCRVGRMYVTIRWPASCATTSPDSPPPPVASPPSPVASPPPPMVVDSPPPSSGVAPLAMTWEWMPSVHELAPACGQSVLFSWGSGQTHQVWEQHPGEPTDPATTLCNTTTAGALLKATTPGPASYLLAYDATQPNVRNFFCNVGTVHCTIGQMYLTIRWPASCSASPLPPPPVASSPPPVVVASPSPPTGVAPLNMTWEWMPSVHELAPACGQSVLFSWGSGQTHQVWEQHPGEPTNPSTTLCNTSTAGAVLKAITPGPASYLLAYDASQPNVRNFFCNVGTVHCTVGQMYLTIRWPASCSGSASPPPAVMTSPPPPSSGAVVVPWGEDGTPHRVDVTCGTKITFVFDYEKHDIRQVKPGSPRYLCSQKRKPMRRLTTFQASPFTYTLTARHAGIYAFIDGFEDHCKEDGTWTIVRVTC